MLAQVCKDFCTEKDGESFCPLRFAFLGVMAVYTLGIFHDFILLADYTFSTHAKDIASGYGDILGLGGAAIAGKNYTESA